MPVKSARAPKNLEMKCGIPKHAVGGKNILQNLPMSAVIRRKKMRKQRKSAFFCNCKGPQIDRFVLGNLF